MFNSKKGSGKSCLMAQDLTLLLCLLEGLVKILKLIIDPFLELRKTNLIAPIAKFLDIPWRTVSRLGMQQFRLVLTVI